jgi:hypothetical protein
VFWDLRLVQGVHTRVVEKLCESSARSALELCFKFREENDRWAHYNNSLILEGKTLEGVHIIVTEHFEEDMPELLNTLRSLQGVH